LGNYDFYLVLNETPEIRSKVCSDLYKVVSYLEGLIPGCVVGLWGSFSYGEGRVKKVDGKIEYINDLDVYVYINSFMKYLKWNNKEFKNLHEKLNVNAKIDVWVKCIPLIKLGLSFGGFPKILNQKKLDIFKEKKISKVRESIKYLLTAYNNLFRYIISEKEEYLVESYIRLYRSLECYKRKNKYVYSLKNNLKTLETYKKKLTKEQYNIINLSIQKKYGLKKNPSLDFNSIFSMKPLFYHLFFRLQNKKSFFCFRYQLIVLKYLFFHKKIKNPFINFNKKRLIVSHYLLRSIVKKNNITNVYLKEAEKIVSNIFSEKPTSKSKENIFKWIADKLVELYK